MAVNDNDNQSDKYSQNDDIDAENQENHEITGGGNDNTGVGQPIHDNSRELDAQELPEKKWTKSMENYITPMDSGISCLVHTITYTLILEIF